MVTVTLLYADRFSKYSFAIRLGNKYETKSSLDILPHLKPLSMLPCHISGIFLSNSGEWSGLCADLWAFII